MKYANDLGFAFHLMLATASASSLTSFSLISSYLVSPRTLAQVRPTLFVMIYKLWFFKYKLFFPFLFRRSSITHF